MTDHLRQPALGGKTDLSLLGTPALAPRGLYRSAGKRALDLACVALLAIPTLLIILPLALLIARDGTSPFYTQDRLGRNGRIFRMWKLRSMVADADAKLEAHLEAHPQARAEWDRTQKLRVDPRITPIGRLIRKTSLDELPQLFNVMRGDMSIVGPRPMMTCQRALYPGAAYYEMRPGITGAWQTSVRHESSFSERATYDTAYYKDLSLTTDLDILRRTVGVVLKGTGC